MDTPEQARKVCSDQLVRRWCTRGQKGSLSHPFDCRRKVPSWHARRHQRAQRGPSLASHSLSDLIHSQSDVAPALIMKRVEAASGAKYSAHNEKARKFDPIAPVGTNYTPIGKPDIAAMRRVNPVPASSRPSAVAAPRPVFGAPVPAPMKTAPPSNVADDDWGDEPPVAPPPPPAASRPPVLPSAPRPAPTSVSIGSRCGAS